MEVTTRNAMVAPPKDPYHGALCVFGRFFNVCSPDLAERHNVEDFPATIMASPVMHKAQDGRAELEEPMSPTTKALQANCSIRRMTLADLADGPYFAIVAQLGQRDLCTVDAACRLTHQLNRAYGGPWCGLGQRAFHGLEVDGDTIFELEDGEPIYAGDGRSISSSRLARVDWKSRYCRFASEVKMFRSPFNGSEITKVDQADEIAYLRCMLRTDLLFGGGRLGSTYLEVQVNANPDNVSLAVVDFEGGGCSSVTFSPDTGAVIRERKVRESPRKVEGTYIQPLSTITSGQGFEGSMGLFFEGGHLAFFRRHTGPESVVQPAPWESTGFVTDLSWAEGRRLTPCLAFRDTGTYNVRLTCIGTVPPVPTEKMAAAYDDSNWRSLDWDANEQEALDM